MKDKATSLAAAFIVVLIVTTVVLPRTFNPDTESSPKAIQSFFNLLATASKTLLGTKPHG